MVTCDIPFKSNFHTSSMTSGPLLPFLKCLLLDSFIISSSYSAIDMLRCGTWRQRTEKRRGKKHMKKRVTEEEKCEVQSSKWWTTEEFEETEGKGECWPTWSCVEISEDILTGTHIHLLLSICPKNHHHFIALDDFYVFMHMTPHSMSILYWV